MLRPALPVPFISESIHNSLLELSNIFRNSMLSKPREYPLTDIVDDIKPASPSLEDPTTNLRTLIDQEVKEFDNLRLGKGVDLYF